MKYADYIERKRHGSPDFPIQYYDVDHTHPQYIMVPHWHKEFEIIRVLDGIFPVYLNSTEIRLTAGDILLVPGGSLHGGKPIACHYECLVFDMSMLQRSRKDAVEAYLLPLINATVELDRPLSDGKTSRTCHALFAAMKEGARFYELTVYGLLFALVSQLYNQDYIRPRYRSPHNQQAQTVTGLLDWIEANFSDPITLETLAAVSGLSAKYLCRIFKEYTGKTVIDYVNELRIENACYEISVKGISITQAAYDNGFNDLSYFCKVFKRYKGVTPRNYKKTRSHE